MLAKRGYLVKISQEAAGYTGGDVKFLKGEVEVQMNKSLFWDWVSNASILSVGVDSSDGRSRDLVSSRDLILWVSVSSWMMRSRSRSRMMRPRLHHWWIRYYKLFLVNVCTYF